MQCDNATAYELAQQFFLRGVERIAAHAIFDSLGYHKYPKKKARAARETFVRAGMMFYDRHMVVDPKSFGRLKEHKEYGYKEADD